MKTCQRMIILFILFLTFFWAMESQTCSVFRVTAKDGTITASETTQWSSYRDLTSDSTTIQLSSLTSEGRAF